MSNEINENTKSNVSEAFEKNSIEKTNANELTLENKKKFTELKDSFSKIVQTIDVDYSTHKSICKTPERAADAFMYFTNGYNQNLSCKSSKETVNMSRFDLQI
jgi:GTP cyclohydrolase I